MAAAAVVVVVVGVAVQRSTGTVDVANFGHPPHVRRRGRDRLERTLGVNPGPSLTISGPTPFMSPIPYTARFP